MRPLVSAVLALALAAMQPGCAAAPAPSAQSDNSDVPTALADADVGTGQDAPGGVAVGSPQDEHYVLLESFAASVNNETIMLSDLKGEISILRWIGEEPGAPRVVLQNMVRRKLIAAQAKKLRMTVTDAEVEKATEELAAEGGEPELFWHMIRDLGLMRDDVSGRMREELLDNKLMALRKRSTYVSESDVRAFYEEHNDVFGDRPLGAAREDIREYLMSKKYQAELSTWIDRQLRYGEVKIVPVPEELK